MAWSSSGYYKSLQSKLVGENFPILGFAVVVQWVKPPPATPTSYMSAGTISASPLLIQLPAGVPGGRALGDSPHGCAPATPRGDQAWLLTPAPTAVATWGVNRKTDLSLPSPPLCDPASTMHESDLERMNKNNFFSVSAVQMHAFFKMKKQITHN